MDTVKDIAALQVGFFLCGDGCQRNALVRLHFFLPHDHLITPQRDFLLLQAEKFAPVLRSFFHQNWGFVTHAEFTVSVFADTRRDEVHAVNVVVVTQAG